MNREEEIIARETVHAFAVWSQAYGDEDQRRVPVDEWVADYLDNFRVVACNKDKDEGVMVIDVALGSFDHGAGNAIIVLVGDTAAVFYEDTVEQFQNTLGLMQPTK